MPSNPLLVFISYAHESPDFREQVLELAESLRSYGVPVITDHIFEDRAPKEGWPIWMQKQVMESHIVLMVCTEKYFRRFQKQEVPGQGRGVTWEGAIITQDLYDSSIHNTKYFPILPDGGNHDHVPHVLRAYDNFHHFPSGIEGIVRLVAAPIEDPNANLPPLRIPSKKTAQPQAAQPKPRCPGLLLGHNDNRLQPNQGEVLGRDKEIGEVLAFLNGHEDAAVVAALVAGSGGIGKTEVCKAGLKAWLKAKPDQVAYYMAFSDTATPDEAIATIGQAMGKDNVANWQELQPHLLPGLYYLDNLESIAQQSEGQALLNQLKSQPGLRLLASSRVQMPRIAHTIPVEKLQLPDAIKLFVREWTGQPPLDESDPALAVFVEKELGCHALSIVLMAALGDTYSLPRLVQAWKERGTALAKDAVQDGRLASLQASLHLTSDVLAKYDGALLLWGLAALCPDGLAQQQLDFFVDNKLVTAENLQRLVRYNILTRQGNQYDMLPPIARFALDEAVAEQGGFHWPSLRQVALAYLLPLAKRADHIASTDEALQARFELVAQFPMLLRYLLVETKLALPDLKTLQQFNYHLLNRYKDRIAFGKEIADALHTAFSKEVNALSFAEISLKKGDLEMRVGNPDEARRLYGLAIASYEREQSGLGLANAQLSLGDLERRVGNLDEARRLYGLAMAGYEREQSGLGLANAQLSLGDLEYYLDNNDEARRLYGLAIAGYEREQDGLGLANAQQLLGNLERWLGNPDEARHLYGLAIAGYEREQNGLGLAGASMALGDIEREAGKQEMALSFYDKAKNLYQKEQSINGLAYILAEQVRCYFALNKTNEMQAAAKEAILAAKASNLPPVMKYIKEALEEAGLSLEEFEA